MTEPVQGFILAAGLGTRMGPLSRALPKPAWPLNGRALLQWSADGLRGAGLSLLACNAHHLPERLRAVAQDLELHLEPELLGSAGGLSHVRNRSADPLAVWNADALGEVPWRAFISAHQAVKAQLSWLLVPHPGGPWNPVWLDESGRVLAPGKQGRGPFHFTGASLWGAEALALLPEGPCDTKQDLLPKLDGHFGIVVPPFAWHEVGTPDQLITAAALLAPTAEGRIPGCYVHPTAEPVPDLQRCVLGPGARPHPGDRDLFCFEEAGQQVRLALD